MKNYYSLILIGSGLGLWFTSLLYILWLNNTVNLILLFLLVLQTIVLGLFIISGPFRPMVLSPLYILAIYALGFYVILPHIALKELGVGPIYISRAESYIGGFGEALIIQFCAFCLVLTALGNHLLCARIGSFNFEVKRLNSKPLFFLCLGIVLILVLMFFLNHFQFFLNIKEKIPYVFGKQIEDSFTPLISICLIVITYIATLRKGIYHVAFVATMAVFLGVQLTNAELIEGRLEYPSGYYPTFICLTAIFFNGVMNFTSKRKLVFSIGIMIGVLLLVFSMLGIFRYGLPFQKITPHEINFAQSIKNTTILKLFHRQINSADCFDRVSKSNLLNDTGSPFYFLSGVVPRKVWPEKPNLSRGEEYMRKFCWPHSKNTFSELITILGEPIIEAGAGGLVVAQIFLGVILFTITIYVMSGGLLRLIVLISLLPWLAHFQQHYALFLANSAKMFIYMLPVVFLLLVFQKNKLLFVTAK